MKIDINKFERLYEEASKEIDKDISIKLAEFRRLYAESNAPEFHTHNLSKLHKIIKSIEFYQGMSVGLDNCRAYLYQCESEDENNEERYTI